MTQTIAQSGTMRPVQFLPHRPHFIQAVWQDMRAVHDSTWQTAVPLVLTLAGVVGGGFAANGIYRQSHSENADTTPLGATVISNDMPHFYALILGCLAGGAVMAVGISTVRVAIARIRAGREL